MVVGLTIRMLFSFYGTETGTKDGWVNLSSLFEIELFNTQSNNYKNWKDKFIKLMGQDGTSMVRTRANEAPGFPLT